MSSAQTEVRSALAAYLDGITPLPEFEQSVARLLAGRRSARGVVHSALKAAVADGTLPPESLRRLGLVDTQSSSDEDIPDTEERPSSNRPLPSNAARSHNSSDPKEAIRPASKPRGQKAARASSESPDTGTEWIENRRTNSEIPECGVLLGNRYRLERVLGEGGMGVVFLATDQEVRGELFAIKVLRPEIRANPESLRLLREEVRRTRALRHPHIVGVYSLNSDPSGVYMLMEYLEGKPLKTLLDEEFGRGMPLMRAWPMIYDIGSALAYAHDHNVVHSDIKPSNVIITSSGSCKLLDFGIARADRNRTTTRDATVIGALTPAYASCEMFEGRAPDQSDDVYALACVIYEMLTGKHPFGRINAMDARARKLQPAPIKVLTGRQNQALAKALEFDRKRRTASVEILLEGLKGMANNERDRRAWISSAAAIAAIGAVSTGWFLEHRAAHSRDSVVDAIPAAPQAPTATSSAASAPAAPESRAAAPTVSKVEHGKDVARPDLGATATSPSKAKPAAAVVAASVADTGPAMIKPMAAPAIPSAAPAKASAALSNAAPANAAPAITTSVGSNGAPLLAQNKPTPAPAGVEHPATGSATPPVHSKANSASAEAEPTVTGSATPPSQTKTTPASVAAEPRETDDAPLLAQSKTIPALAAEPSPSGSAIPPVQSKTTAAVTTESPATASETPPEQSTVLTKEPVVAATSIAGAAAAPTHATPSAVPTTEQTPLPPASPVDRGEIDRPPYGKKLPAVIATTDSLAQMESEKNCPYPAQARAAVETGTAVLLVYVSPDGSAANAQLDTDGTSSSPVLDQAAIKCVREWGRFPPKLVGSKAVGYWARTKFRWSFGGF